MNSKGICIPFVYGGVEGMLIDSGKFEYLENSPI